MIVNVSKLNRLNKGGSCVKNVDLKEYTTFKLGGKAKYMVTISTIEGLIKVMDYISARNIDYFILGAGSNLLISDNGYNGIVIKLAGDFARFEQTEDGLVSVGGGMRIAKAYAICKDLGQSGLEVLATIPATIGGAVYMNAGAFGEQISDHIEYVTALVDGKIKYFCHDDCHFGYRSSVFQNLRAIILRVGFSFENGSKEKIELAFKEALQKKRALQPLEYPSAGSVFKRIDGLNVSKMLDDMGIKGMRVGGVMVSYKHANFILNLGGTAKDVYLLIHKIKKMFKDKYDINLETEIKFLGEFE